MEESNVGKNGGEQDLLLPDVLAALRQDGVWNAPEPSKRKADDAWLAFAAEDPAFFIKPFDTV